MLYESAYFSLFVQAVAGAINVYGLNMNIPKNLQIYKDLLKIEFVVQIIEFIFYIWMILNFSNIKNITQFRYFDWILTTPIMLIALMAYLDDNKPKTLYEYVINNKDLIIRVVGLNLSMLILGLLGELQLINYNMAITLGFIPFLYYFKLIYDKYMNKKVSNDKFRLFWFFFIIWTLYGVVAYLPYEQKNTAYNILDLFSKNLFGVFLVYILSTFKK